MISPDLESGTLSKLSPRNRSGHAEKTASFAFASRLESCPESRDSPGISGRQRVTSRKKGVLAKRLATQEWLMGNLCLTRSPIISPDLESGRLPQDHR
jgi:hypothetical protein